MSFDEFSDELIDLLVIGPCCPMPPGMPEPYAVHRNGDCSTAWILPHAQMSAGQKLSKLQAIRKIYGLPTDEDLRKIHPNKARAEVLIRERALNVTTKTQIEPIPPDES